MKTKWTDKQMEAITSRKKNLLVSAAAGSGKTAVMVERIISLMIEERVKIEELLIVTFTNAAAGEMKDRIQRKLQEKRKDLLLGPDREEEKDLIAFLTRQIQNIPGASISTLHSFCIDILKDNFQLAGIDPRFKLVNESLAAILVAQALDNVLEDRYSRGEEDFLRLVESFSDSKTDKKLMDLVKNIDRFIQAQPQPEDWLRKQASFYKNLASFENQAELLDFFYQSDFFDLFLEDILSSLDRALEIFGQAAGLAEDYSPQIPAIENLRDDMDQLLLLRERIKSEGDAASLEGLRQVAFSRLKSPKKAEKDLYDEESLERVKKLRNDGKKAFDKALDALKLLENPNLLGDFHYMGPMVEELVDLVLAYRAEHARLKEEKAVLDFSDLEHMALRVLEDDQVRESLQARFRYIFFDEYQDTNMVQETIVQRIRREDNLFFVGDVKQSIYRFRLADPSIFNRKYKEYEEEDQSKKIDLSMNFRSRPEILHFSNLIFREIMSQDYGEVDYQNKDHQLWPGPGKDFDPYEDHIEFALIEKPKMDYDLDESEELEEDLDSMTLQASYIANRIRGLVREGYDYRDMAILIRSPKGKTKTFEDVFEQYGIPLYVDYQSSNYDSLEIRCLVDYLKVVDNQRQDEALLGVMSSVFGNFDNEELIAIREAYPNYAFYEAARAYADREEALGLKIRNFYSNLAEDIALERMMGLDDFIWTMVEKRGFSTYVEALDNGEQRLHNLKSFIGKAREYEQTEARGLFGFLRQLDSLLKEEVEDKNISTIIDTENVVNLMSIHKSKGLEFKVVFLCNLEKNVNEMDLRQDLILHNELGLGLKYMNPELKVKDDNLLLDIIKKQKRRETISEEIRILYVAMTRAVDRLYLVGSLPDLEKFAEGLVGKSIQGNLVSSRNFLSWIASVLIRESKGGVLRDYAEMDPEINDFESKYSIRILSEQMIREEAELYQQEEEGRQSLEELVKGLALEAEIRQEIEGYMKDAYPYQADCFQRSKTSVTELTKEYKNREREDSYLMGLAYGQEAPLFEKDETIFKASEIGTIVHFLMESLPIKTYDLETLESEIERMLDLELLTQEEAQVLPRERVLAFFDSDLGRRMIASKNVRREASFLMKQEGYLLEGVIDCYFEEGDQLILLDYKTDAKMDAGRHRDQLALYKEALEAMEDKAVKEAYIYWISHDRFTQLDL